MTDTERTSTPRLLASGRLAPQGEPFSTRHSTLAANEKDEKGFSPRAIVGMVIYWSVVIVIMLTLAAQYTDAATDFV
ncbi:MAG: hypothetical protein P8176_14365, partial [Gammaproteobacteria bacterium]